MIAHIVQFQESKLREEKWMERKKYAEIKISVDSSDLDEAIKKASQLKDLLLEINSLSGSIIERSEAFR